MKALIKSQYFDKEISLGIVEPSEQAKCRKIMILLHGFNGSFDVLASTLPLQDYASKYGYLLCVPDADPDYYIDREGKTYSLLIAEEIPNYLKHRYRLQEDTEVVLAGISMGGYGALIIGLRNPNNFTHIISISGAFIAGDVAIGNPEVVGNSKIVNDFFLKIFAPVDTLEASPTRSPEGVINGINDTANLPKMILICGEQDLLLARNLKILDLLKQKEILYSWHRIPGDHENDCFQRSLYLALEEV